MIPPGQSEQAKFTRDTRKLKGPFTKTIRVTTNDPANQNVSLVCTGSVRAPFKVTPNVVSFGQIERTSEALQKTVTITRGDGGPLALELLPVKHANIQASLREIEAGEHYELDVDVIPPWPNRMVQTNLTLKTGVSQAPEQTVRVYARIAPRLRVIPTRFSVPQKIDSERDLRVRLVWSGGDPGKILEVTASDPRTSASFEEAGGQQYVVLHVPKGYTLTPRSRPMVIVKTDDPQAPTLRIQTYPARTPRTPRATPPTRRTTRSTSPRDAGVLKPPVPPTQRKPEPPKP